MQAGDTLQQRRNRLGAEAGVGVGKGQPTVAKTEQPLDLPGLLDDAMPGRGGESEVLNSIEYMKRTCEVVESRIDKIED